MSENWREEQLKRRSETIEAIAAAHVDAGNVNGAGFGWIKVDASGNLMRIDPNKYLVQVKRLRK